MVEMTQGTNIRFDKPCVAVSSFGFAEMAVQAALGMLEEAGFTPIVCHAQGKGDRAMEEMIRDGAFHGVLDICTGGVMEHLFKGNRDPGPERLMAAVETGIPMVLAPCGLDILSYGGRPEMLAKTKDRVQYVQDALRVQVRTTAEELRQAADVFAERLNRARGPWSFLIPLKGWSSLDKEGRPIYDPVADAAFVARLKEKLADPSRMKAGPASTRRNCACRGDSSCDSRPVRAPAMADDSSGRLARSACSMPGSLASRASARARRAPAASATCTWCTWWTGS
jgi:uncharacterized protein (UPF0261 family)